MGAFTKPLKALAESVFPYFCLSCGALQPERYLCDSCFSNFEIFQSFFCPFCFKRMPVPDNSGYYDVGQQKLSCEEHKNKTALWGLGIATPYENELLRTMLYAYKYKSVSSLAGDFSRILTTYLYAIRVSFAGFVVVPIPLHRKKLRRRGFNQTELLAEHVASALGLKMRGNMLFKTKWTEPQVEAKNAAQREQNISGSFSAKNCEGFNILLVDDIVTTGATLEEAAKTLKESGAKKVFGLVLAKG